MTQGPKLVTSTGSSQSVVSHDYSEEGQRDDDVQSVFPRKILASLRALGGCKTFVSDCFNHHASVITFQQ